MRGEEGGIPTKVSCYFATFYLFVKCCSGTYSWLIFLPLDYVRKVFQRHLPDWIYGFPKKQANPVGGDWIGWLPPKAINSRMFFFLNGRNQPLLHGTSDCFFFFFIGMPVQCIYLSISCFSYNLFVACLQYRFDPRIFCQDLFSLSSRLYSHEQGWENWAGQVLMIQKKKTTSLHMRNDEKSCRY